MTANDFFQLLAEYPLHLAAGFAAPPLLALLLPLLHGKGGGGRSPWHWLYGVLVYVIAVPGILASTLVVYTMFFTHQSLLDVPLAIYLAPIVSMVATLALMSRGVDLDDVPGFERLSGLVGVLVITFVILVVMHRMRVWLVFGASIFWLIGIALALFLLLRAAAGRAFGSAGSW